MSLGGLHRQLRARSLDLNDFMKKDVNDSAVRDTYADFALLAVPSRVSVASTAMIEELESGRVTRPRGTGRLKRVQGLGYIVVAALCYSIVALCVKVTSEHASSNVAVFWRMSIALAASSIWLCYKRQNLIVERKYWGILLFRCGIGTISVSLKFYAMCNMVLTDAVSIIYTSPVFTFLLGATILGEPVGCVDVVATLISFVGLLFVTKPEALFPANTREGDKGATFAALSALGASVALAIVYTIIRRMRGVDKLVSIHYFLMFGTCYSALSLLAFDESLFLPLEPKFLLAIVGSGFFAYIGQVFLTMGFEREKAGIASVMRYFDVAFVLIWDVTALDERVTLLSVVGALIIFVGAATIVIHKARVG